MPIVPQIFSYVVARDFGFAPNPFFGTLTLATCKPAIRRRAQHGSYVLGVGGRSRGLEGRLIYFFRVEGSMSFQDYWASDRFVRKRPNLCGSIKVAFGDNIYHQEHGDWVQEDSHHSFEHGRLNRENLGRDTSVNRILFGSNFSYFGSNHIEIPSSLLGGRGRTIQAARYDLSRFPPDFSADVIDWLENQIGFKGLVGLPLDWS